MHFSDSFYWGTSTSAYQIEGGVAEGGRSPSIWDTFCAKQGAIKNGHTGEVACDHYNRLDEDLDLIQGLGVKHYRFSTSWSRILPAGVGKINQQGADFYNALIDGCLERGVEPWITLYHWDIPQILEDKGGWTSRDVIDWFSEYADKVTDLYGDRVSKWMILNEPSVFSYIGYLRGEHAPGARDEQAYIKCVHNANLVVGKTYRDLKRKNANWKVGSTYTVMPLRPEAEDTPQSAVDMMAAFWHRNFADPLFKGQYPDVFKEEFAPLIQPGDMETIKVNLDFVGIQHYNPIEAKYSEDQLFNVDFGNKPDDKPKTDIGWLIDPDAFYETLVGLKSDYGDFPIIITENGAAYYDKISEDGKIHDQYRIDFLNSYIASMKKAMDEGVNVEGYFVWSLFDNFEWSEGYGPRFGLVYVDYENDIKRIPKESYSWYRGFIKKS